MVTDANGNKTLDAHKASLYWGEGKLPIVDVWSPKARIPQLEELINSFKGVDVAIAGGAVLGALDAVEYTDIDVFPLTTKGVIDAETKLNTLGYTKTEVKDHYWMFTKEDSCCRPVQLILVHTDVQRDVQRLLNRFDLSVCQVAVYQNVLHSNTIAMRDIKLKYLRVTGTSNVGSLLVRLTKYAKRGYLPQTGKEVVK